MLVMVLTMAACSSEDDIITTGDEMSVTFTATLDQYIDSRAISDGSMVDKLIFIAYQYYSAIVFTVFKYAGKHFNC